MERVERRPMTSEERAQWIKRVRQAQATEHRCKTCGGAAVICFGDVLGENWYCHRDAEVQRERRARVATTLRG